jgi:uncharacterized protein
MTRDVRATAVSEPATSGDPPSWTAPSARDRLALMRRTTTVALVGASTNPARPSYFVASYLVSSSPFEVYFVNPKATELFGRPVYPSLEALPLVPDLVDVFRRSEDLPDVLSDAIDVGAKAVWFQLGLWREDVALDAEAAGLDVVMDRCLKIEHARFHGGLHLAGFDTGVISSRRTLR